MKDDSVMWNPFNKVVQSHRDGTINIRRTNQERKKRGLPTPWKPSMSDVDVKSKALI